MPTYEIFDVCDRCVSDESVEIMGYADQICIVCPHVPLCKDCFKLHEREAAEDDTFRIQT